MPKRKRTTQDESGMTPPSLTLSTSASTDSPIRTPLETPDPPPTEPKMPSTDELELSFGDLERDPQELVAAGFRPVWSFADGYPGPLPADVAEWIDPELGTSSRFIGPMSSLFWLAGLDDLVDAIDNPTYTMSDEIINIPSNATIPSMVNLLWEYGKIPSVVYNIQFDLPQGPIVARPVRHEIPSIVTGSLSSYNLRELFPICRQRDLPRQVHSARVSWTKNSARLARDIERDFTRALRGNLLYRALPTEALFSSMLFFIPVIASSNNDNEFGPGIYTTTSLEHALNYAAIKGALMVFQNPDFRNLNVSELSGDDWTFITSYFLRYPTSNAREPLPSAFDDTDVIRGAISTAKRGKGAARVPGPERQLVAVRYASCGALAVSLKMIIWFD